MRIPLFNANRRTEIRRTFLITASMVAVAILVFAAVPARGAISWDGESGTQWWFDPVNWNTNDNINTALPPSNGAATPTATDIQINVGTGGLPGGEGVVYDPANDPNFASAGTRVFPAGYGPQIISQFYLSRGTTNFNLLTIKGDMEIRGAGSLGPIVGRSSGMAGVPADARLNQLAGNVTIVNRPLDIGSTDTGNPGYGNGVWDYRGGILEVSPESGQGLRLSAGGSAGTGGHGRFIMHNPTTPGYVRPYTMNVAAHSATADGITNGIGTVEFHFENGGTRPIQVIENLVINNGMESTGQVRSARLELVLDGAPMVDGGGVPQDLGLFDVDFFDPDQLIDPTGAITGGGANARQFSNADGTVLYSAGSTVSATFGGTQYDWTISYTGEITWVGSGDTGVVSSISDTGGTDIVLKGLSSLSVGLLGDYNNNGGVDAADYVLWRDGGPLQNEGDNPGVVNQADYDFWRSQFGKGSAGSGAALSVAAVPEPGAILLAVVGVIGMLAVPRRSRAAA